MATGTEIIDFAMSRLGKRSSTSLRADVIDEINAAIDRLERGDFKPWFLQSTIAATFTNEGDDTATLASTFGGEQEESRPWWQDDDGEKHFLTKRFYGQLLTETTTEVRYYSIVGNTSFLIAAAAPEDGFTVTVPSYLRYTGDLADTDDTVTNPWLIDAKDWVLMSALRRVASLHLRDMELVGILQGLEAEAKREVYIYHELRMNMNQEYRVGGSSDGT